MKEEQKKGIYTTPYSTRVMENAHIVLWLIKDTCWAMFWRPGGIIMITPTIAVAFYLLWQSRKSINELMHNLAVCLWICGNSLWMAGEFYGHDFRPWSVALFATGLTLLATYYIFTFSKRSKVNSKKIA